MAEKKVIELEVKENLGNLKQQLKAAQLEVQTLADKFGVTSDQAREAAKRAAELKDKIGDAKALTDAFNPDAKFKGLGQALTGVTGGFAAVQGAMGLIGVESENVEKQLLKVQSAMALAAGIDQLTEAKESFLNLGRTAVKAFNSIKAAIGGTGIGLIVIALGTIYAYWEDISKAIGLSTKETEKYANQQKLIGEEAKKQREEVAKQSSGFATLIAQLKATNVNSEERVKLIKKINDNYGTTIQNLKDETKFQNALNKELASYLEYQKAKYQLQKNEEFIVKNLEKQDELRAKIAKAQKDRDKAIEDGAGKQKRTLEEGITTYVSLNEEADKTLAKANETISKSNKELEAAEKRFENYGSAANRAEKNIDKLTEGGKKYVEQIKKDEPKVTEVVKKEKEEQLVLTRKHSSTVIAEIVSEGTKRLEKEKAISEKSIQIAKEEKEKKAAILQQQLTLVKDSFQAFADVATLFAGKNKKAMKTAFVIQKASNIAQTTIDTYTAAMAAYKSALSVPVIGTALAPIAAAGATAVGLLNIRKIAASQFEGGGTPSADTGGGAPTMSAPEFNVVGQSGLNQLASLNQQPIQAYVVSGQVTSQQALDRNRLENATLGG